MDKIIQIIEQACLKHRDSGEASCTKQARMIIDALKKEGYEIMAMEADAELDKVANIVISSEQKIYSIKDYIESYLKGYEDHKNGNKPFFKNPDAPLHIEPEKELCKCKLLTRGDINGNCKTCGLPIW